MLYFEFEVYLLILSSDDLFEDEDIALKSPTILF